MDLIARRIPAQRSTFEIADAVVSTLSNEREGRALWIGAADDPPVARYFNGAFEDVAAIGLHALSGIVDVSDIEVSKASKLGRRRAW